MKPVEMKRRVHRDSTQVREIQDDAKGIVFNIQRYSIQDGPGIRTTVFMKGCPLRCLWCSNPESQKIWPEVAHRDSLCNKCGLCVDVCDVQAISVDDKGVHINRKRCTNCSKCVEVCTTEALKVFGKEMSVEEVFQEVVKDVDFYRNSGGGVTLSGGEPLLQPAFAAAFFKLCQDAGINTCLDTSGLASASALEQVLPYTSLVLFDVKLSDPMAHRRWAKRSNEKIIRNLASVVTRGIPVIIRVPLIPGINDSDKELKGIARIAADSLNGVGKVNLLPYHRYGASKYKMLDRRYRLNRLVRQKDAELQRAKQIFESFGFDCEVVE